MARRTFTIEFKTAAAKLVIEQGYTQKKAADSLGVDPASIRGWIRLYISTLNSSSPMPKRCRPRTIGSAKRIGGCSWSARFPKKRRSSSPRNSLEICIHHEVSRGLSRGSDVQGSQGLSQRLLCPASQPSAVSN